MRPALRLALCLALVSPALAPPSHAGEQGSARPEETRPPGVSPIDLATTLRLVGASAVEIQIARTRLAAARANATSALSQLFPALSAGAGYRRHAGVAQDVAGNVVPADKTLYSAAAAVTLQVDVGEGIYNTLAARQLRAAAERQLEAERQEALGRAAQAYFDLLVGQAQEAVATEALSISRDYEAQLQRAVEAGIALRGDALRVKVQTRRDELALQQASEQRALLSARLVEALRLDPAVTLVAQDAELAPVALVDATQETPVLVAQAFAARPELEAAAAIVRAADATRKAAALGPLVPTLVGQASFGGIDGGRDLGATASGGSRDYVVGVGWRLGPGGIFDLGRTRLARAHLDEAGWQLTKIKDRIAREVVEARARALSQQQQLATARQALGEAREGLDLARARKEFEVAVVLENILALQDATRARLDYARAVGEYAKAQYALLRALGRLAGAGGPQAGAGPER